MSYSICLTDPVNHETLKIPPHIMYGGIMRAEVSKSGKMVPTTCDEAWLNITYNYSKWYYSAFDKGETYYNSIRMVKRETDGSSQGIRSIYGMSGVSSINEISYAIAKISNTEIFKDLDVSEKSLEDKYEIDCRWWNSLSPEGKAKCKSLGMEPKKETVNSYWVPTRDNALRPLYQLLAMAQLRPDGVWDGD